MGSEGTKYNWKIDRSMMRREEYIVIVLGEIVHKLHETEIKAVAIALVLERSAGSRDCSTYERVGFMNIDLIQGDDSWTSMEWLETWDQKLITIV